jgi:hypothetical protein
MRAGWSKANRARSRAERSSSPWRTGVVESNVKREVERGEEKKSLGKLQGGLIYEPFPGGPAWQRHGAARGAGV